MMKYIIILAVSALALTACGGNEQAKLQGLCTGILEGDPQAARELANDNTSVQPFCECYAKSAAAGGDIVLKRHTDVWSALSDIRQKTGVTDIETAAETLEAELRAARVSTPLTKILSRGLAIICLRLRTSSRRMAPARFDSAQ